MSQSTEKHVILVVDDSPDNLTLISGILKERYKVKAANGGGRALTICQGDLPDLVLLDVLMPDLDGYEVCRRLKADPVTAPVPVVFLSGSATDGDRHLAGTLGAVGFLLKPVDARVLLDTVAGILDPEKSAN